MSDAAPPTPPAAPPAPPAPTTPWYEGKADAETVGHWENKGWGKEDPAKIAIEATKQARELQKHFGVPADQILKLPKDASDEAGWKAVWSRLGVPSDPKEYDFSTVKRSDGTAPDPALIDALRATAADLRVPKDRAGELAGAVVKHLDAKAAAEASDKAAKLAEERTALDKNWGANKPANMFIAQQGAKVLGLTPEHVAALEGVIGYAGVMEAMRRVGVLNKEDAFVVGDRADNKPMTAEGATARMKELSADPAWRKRYLDGDAQAKRDFAALTTIISGVAA